MALLVPSLRAAPALVALAFLSFPACTSSVGGGISTGGEGAGGAPVCGSCYEVYVNGGITCGPGDSADAWRQLANCACSVDGCYDACSTSFCASLPVTGPAPGDTTDMCSTCLGTSCTAQLSNCASN